MGGIFSSATLEQVRAASDIVEVIGGYVPLKRAGANFMALCPFHREKTPSFSVNPQRQIFHCFGCHKGGDVFRFVQDFENIPFPDAVRRLAERARIPIEIGAGGDGGEARHRKEVMRQIHEDIAARWHAALTHDAAADIARHYLEKRGLSAEAIRLFRLGYAPDAWDDTVNWAKNKGHDIELVEESGLVIRRDGGGFYDRFRGRLIFPINDEQGRVIGFSGRVLSGDEKTAKYVNSPETPLFRKGRIIYGLDKSKRAVLDAGYAIVCEGQLDLIACYMAGVQNVVAPQGTALTADHARLLKRYTEEVVLCFDSDAAGQNAAVRALDELLASGLAIRVARMPAPHDPDSYIREHGGDRFRALVESSPGYFDYYLEHLLRNEDVATDRGRLAVARGMAEALAKTGSAVLWDTYAQKTAIRLGVSPEAMRAEFKARKPAMKQGAPEPETEAAPQAVERPDAIERWLLKLMFLADTPPAELAALNPAWVSHAGVRAIVEARLAAEHSGAWEGLPQFLEGLADPNHRSWVTEAVSDPRPVPNPEVQLKDLVRRLRDQDLDRKIQSIGAKLGDPELSDEERARMAREQIDLRARKKTPLEAG